MIISMHEAKTLLEAKAKGLNEAVVSLNLNISKSRVKIQNSSFIFPDGQILDESKLKKALKDTTSCFLVKGSSLLKIQLFSNETNRFYKLVA